MLTALLAGCYTHHLLCMYVDSPINYIRLFIKIPFVNKGIDFIDPPSIFRDNTLESSIPIKLLCHVCDALGLHEV